MAQTTALFTGGSDTTATELNAFFYFVLSDERVYAKVKAEVDEAFDSGLLSFPVRYALATKLEYLQACLKEAMRLLPSTSIILPRRVPKGGMVASGHFLPEGTSVGMSTFCFQRAKAAYGEDAEFFRPERWIGIGVEERAAMEKNFLTVSTIFGAH